jgi:exodeoxyribonuclease III
MLMRVGYGPCMRIASLNINNIQKRLPNLLEWLRRAKPDVVCLQELKTEDAQFLSDAIRRAGYESVWRGQKSWNGVTILARGATPIVTRTGLPGDPADEQTRYLEAAVSGVLVASFYAPNGNPQPGPKFDYKLAWVEAPPPPRCDALHVKHLTAVNLSLRYVPW